MEVMLKSSRLHKQAYRKFVCWQCLARLHNGLPQAGSESSNIYSYSQSDGLKRSHRSISTSVTNRATIDARARHSAANDISPFSDTSTQPSIRQRLKQWEQENKSLSIPFQDPFTPKFGPGDFINTSFRNAGEFVLEPDDGTTGDGNDGFNLVFDKEELVDVGTGRTYLVPGDLVELTSINGRLQELAIFVRELDDQSQFYCMSGRWAHRSARKAKFYVPSFVESHELESLLPFLPQAAVPQDMVDKMQGFMEAVPRDIGKPLLQKMADFWAQTEAVYQAAATRLDSAHNRVADPTRFTYATLNEIADRVLSPVIPKGDDGRFSKPALYAVHRSLLRDDISYRAQSRGTLRAGGEYEISSINEVENVVRVTEYVRKYREEKMKPEKAGKGLRSPLHSFISMARKLIDLSRKDRVFTCHGTLGPSSTKGDGRANYRSGTVKEKFKPADEEIIRFLESWACLNNFGAHSAFNGIGSTILRAVKRYDGVALNQKTAWTFLKEIGVIPPWQSFAHFEARLPGTGRRLDMEPRESVGGFTPDRLAGIRKDWCHLAVYCIDDPGAHELDDGVSLEATESPEEYWIHIHVADPAAHIDPKGPAANFARRMAQTVYMPDRVVTMLNSSFTRGTLSLASGRPCLTFSARMNLNGDILEDKITAGRIRNVFYLSPDVLKEVVMGPSEIKMTVRVVGESSTPPMVPSRRMLEVNQLSHEQIKQLRMLHKIGSARGAQYHARGGINARSMKPSATISFDSAQWTGARIGRSVQHYGDPTIRYTTEDYDMSTVNFSTNQTVILGNLMLIANEVAARWSYARRIPVIYRVTARNDEKENPAAFFQRVVLQSMDASGRVPTDVMRTYLSLIGQIQPSTTAGPHAGVGAEMLVKCTSPLRRYGDLLVHWQIEAALLEEARTGQTLVGNTREDFLPFTEAELNELLPRLDTRERVIKGASTRAERELMAHFLLRAWIFKEADLPSRLEFIVRSNNADTSQVGGFMPQILASAHLQVPERMVAKKVNIGDTFEVEFFDIDTHTGQITVQPVHHFEPSEVAQQTANL